MSAGMLRDRIMSGLDGLSPDEQAQVLAFISGLSARRPPGVRGAELLQYVGTIAKDDLQAMQDAIEADCEQVNHDGW